MAKVEQDFDRATTAGQNDRAMQGMSPTPVNAPGSSSADRSAKAHDAVQSYYKAGGEQPAPTPSPPEDGPADVVTDSNERRWP